MKYFELSSENKFNRGFSTGLAEEFELPTEISKLLKLELVGVNCIVLMRYRK